MSLSTDHINAVLRGNCYTKHYFIGTFPACTKIKPPRRKFYSFVTNTDNHDSPGTHWNAWSVRGNEVLFFDSFGRSPYSDAFPHSYRDILLNFKSVLYSKRCIQHVDSFTCGYFSIHFILCISLGLEIEDFLLDYSNDKIKNDVTVIELLNSIQ